MLCSARQTAGGGEAPDCTWIGSIPTEGTWFEVDASCDFRKAKAGGGMRAVIGVGSGQVVKMRTKEGCRPPRYWTGRRMQTVKEGTLCAMEASWL